MNARSVPSCHKHYYYEASVQGVEHEVDFATKVFRARYGRAPLTLREDFCGTATLACAWASKSPRHHSWGVDLDTPTLDWGREHHLAFLPKKSGSVTLVHDDVRTSAVPAVDMTLALNFSYCVFKTREELRAYFQSAYANLKREGIFVTDIYGGTEAIDTKQEPRRIAPSVAEDGTRVPAFTYVWDQAYFNAINHHVVNHIHFRFSKGQEMQKAFTYDWRLWTIPEIIELMLEAGFTSADAYVSGWKKNGDSDDAFRKRIFFGGAAGWVAYVVGTK